MRFLVVTIERFDLPSSGASYVVVSDRVGDYRLCGYYCSGLDASASTVLDDDVEVWSQIESGRHRLVEEVVVEVETSCLEHPPYVFGPCCRSTMDRAVRRAASSSSVGRPAFSWRRDVAGRWVTEVQGPVVVGAERNACSEW